MLWILRVLYFVCIAYAIGFFSFTFHQQSKLNNYRKQMVHDNEVAQTSRIASLEEQYECHYQRYFWIHDEMSQELMEFDPRDWFAEWNKQYGLTECPGDVQPPKRNGDN
jgi:hypothetical protein